VRDAQANNGAPRNPKIELKTRVGFNPAAFAAIKRNSKLLNVAEQVKAELQNAGSEQVRMYLYAICFRKLFNAVKTQFATEEADAYIELDPTRAEPQQSMNAATLRGQHTTLLHSVREMLDAAEATIKRSYRRTDSLGLLNRFWSFQQTLQRHETAELKLIEEVNASLS